jgi:hypothetical protein
MASIVAGIGASHSIMLMARLEDWPHFAQVDKERAKYYFDKAGNPTNHEALLSLARRDRHRHRLRHLGITGLSVAHIHGDPIMRFVRHYPN